jgi:moderate conductance mechanosensitive channel
VVLAVNWDVTWDDVWQWVVGTPLKIIVILLGAFLAARILRRVIRKVTARVVGFDVPKPPSWWRKETALTDDATAPEEARRSQRAHAIASLLESVVTTVIWVVAVLMIIDLLGINLAPLLAGVSIAGIAIGFGAQSFVADVISGLFMLIEDQYGVGDVVDFGDAQGVVESVTLRTTIVRGVDGTRWYVPNGKIQRVGNRTQGWARAVVDVSVGYGNDLDQVKSVILDAAREALADEALQAKVRGEPEVLGVERLGPEGVTVRLQVQVQAGTQWELQRVLRERVQDALGKAGVKQALPPPAGWSGNRPS